jgi:predicted RND superfamily exporter protein
MKEFMKVRNEKQDLESLLKMEKQKYKRREREVCDVLDAAHDNLQSADVSAFSEAKENVTDDKTTQTDKNDDNEVSPGVLKKEIDELATVLARSICIL